MVIPKRGGVLAIDHGTKRTGFAAADPLRIAVRPLETWRGAGMSPELIEHIAVLLAERDVDTLVLGLPRNMDGSEGPRAAEVRVFGAKLGARFPGLKLEYVDERLTTKAAEELLRESGFHGREARALRDSWSALVILREWLATAAHD